MTPSNENVGSLEWLDLYRKREQAIESAANKAYQIFIEHDLTVGDANQTIRIIESKIRQSKVTLSVQT